ncbi:MAG: hypothetical protein EB084_21010, partial [Proteobacteria bacterium]|nr:hypothetical protein [Pseudomonadota bacterium]
VAECLSPLIEAAHRHDLDAMALEGPPLIAHLRTLSTLFERLREAELTRPIESPIPAVNGVLRVARAVREERLSFDVLAARLRALLPALESAAAEGSGEEASALISAHHQAVEALLGCADSESLDGFDDAASRVRATAQALFDHAQATRGSIDHAPAPPQELPDYAWSLLAIADRLMAGEQCLDELRREASALRLRAEHGLATLHQLPQAPDDAPALEREACADAARIMEHGLSLVLDAVARFEGTCQSGDADTLQDALDHLRAAIEEMRAMPLAFERLRPPP